MGNGQSTCCNSRTVRSETEMNTALNEGEAEDFMKFSEIVFGVIDGYNCSKRKRYA